MAAISAAWSAKACSKAGRKCSGAISANGGVSNGVCHAFSSGLCLGLRRRPCVCRVSDIDKSRLSSRIDLRANYITRSGFFGPFALDSAGLFGEIAARKQDLDHELAALPDRPRQIVWPSVITVISAAILIGAEVFGAAFAGGWALAILFGLDDTGAHILQAVLFAIGVFVMVAFIRAAQRVEPFTRRA